jgi:hypothetical protein
VTQPDTTNPDTDGVLQLRARILALLAHRAQRLANTCHLPAGLEPPPCVVGMFTESVLDAALAYAPEELINALCRRLARDAQIRSGVCIDCRKNPAVGDHGIVLCEACLASERQADREAEHEKLLDGATGRPS